MSNYPDFIQSTGYGDGSGLMGWNCRHSFSPYFDGASIPPNKEQLKALAEQDAQTKTYNTTWGTSKRDPDNPDKWLYRKGDKRVMELTYRDQLDRQNDMTRQMRATRRTATAFKAADLTDEYKLEKAKYTLEMREYEKFSRLMGIDERKETIYIDNLGRL